jgi:uracil-DNA glycosylase family 4
MSNKHDLSRDYLEEALKLARQYMPGWAFAVLQTKARAKSGGRANQRTDVPTLLEKLALRDVKPENLRSVDAAELRQTWRRLNQWFASARKKKQPVEDFVNAGLWVEAEMRRRDMAPKPSPLVERIDALRAATKSDDAVARLENKPDELMDEPSIDNPPTASGLAEAVREGVEAATVGPQGARVAFVGASLDRTAKARSEPLVGSAGQTLKSEYLQPLGLARDQVVLTTAVPRLLVNKQGVPREPTAEEVVEWQDWLAGELEEKRPEIIVALGKTAKHALGDMADFSLPHPSAVCRRGRPESLVRKLRSIKKALAAGAIDPTATIKRQALRKQNRLGDEGGDETHGEVALKNWEENWHTMLPRSGKGRFVVQTHWRGLSKDELDLTDEQLLKTDHSLHADIRFEGDDALWGFAVLGSKQKIQDFLAGKQADEKNQAAIKLSQPKVWLDVGDPPLTVEPGGPGSTSQTYSKFFRQDRGTYELGVARMHGVEVVLDGKSLNGRYVLQFAPVEGSKDGWLIDKPETQTPIAETDKTPDRLIRELRGKRQRFLFFGVPGSKPRVIDVRTGKDVTQKRVPICKADPAKQVIYAVAIDPYTFGDAHNDWVPPKDVEATAHGWMKSSRVIGRSHSRKAHKDTFPVETWLVQYPSEDDYKKAMDGRAHRAYRMPFGNQVVHSGSWIVGTHLGDPDWAAFERGEIGEYSIGAFGFRTPIGEATLPDVTFVDLVEMPAADKSTI